ncbi:GTP 3',8-cyclase MoaA [Burkholderiaceae bacterium DAT-1]|nr:GTP 3',8-cyclase MoaA [Burkholderiaceae bacterium DAT-1]
MHPTFPPSSASGLIDPFGRRIHYLRVSVTDRCDLRCTYCLPKGFKDYDAPANWLRPDEMVRLVSLFVQLGVDKVRLTGGEPLLRRGIEQISAGIADLPGLRDLSLSTNGTMLAAHAAGLKAAGVNRLNVSLDTVDRACFARVTGRDCLDKVLRGLDAARDAGFAPIKLNMVVMPDVNLGEVEQVLQYALDHGFILRLIEPMPMGETGQRTRSVNLTELCSDLADQFGLIPEIKGKQGGPARYWQSTDGRMSLGVITPMSQHFCETCNRVRLGVDGCLYLCLGQNDQVPLGDMMRQGASDADLLNAIRSGIAAKPERHHFNESPTRIVRFMSQTGG